MSTSFTNWESGLAHADYLEDELAHYGVLGMKWGQRRYQNADGSLTAAGKEHYGYQSHATKKYERKANKAMTKAAKYAKKHGIKSVEEGQQNGYLNKQANKYATYMTRRNRSAELDRLEQEGAKHVSVGKAIATRMLLGGDMSKAYHQHLAMMGTSVNKASKGQKTTARIMSYFGGTTYSRLMKAAYIRQDDPGRGKLARLGNKMIEGHKQSANAIDYVGDKAKKYRR